MEKKTVSVTIKLTPDEWGLLTSASNRIWPGAPITKAQIVVGLAKLGAESVDPRKSRKS
jgi:hypothetical protein